MKVRVLLVIYSGLLLVLPVAGSQFVISPHIEHLILVVPPSELSDKKYLYSFLRL